MMHQYEECFLYYDSESGDEHVFCLPLFNFISSVVVNIDALELEISPSSLTL